MSQGVMFHHFHGRKHIKSLGSIGKDQFKKILNYLKKKYNLLPAKIFLNKAINKKLKSNDICLTFDDNLKSQFDIAFPILKKENLTAFFFIYSSVFDKKINLMELFRDFSSRNFKSINDFYNLFFLTFRKVYKKKFVKYEKNYNNNYLRDYKFYTQIDRRYRYARDIILEKKEYEKIMIKMMKIKKYNIKENSKNLFMTKKQISTLIENENIIGLHSHSHYSNLKKINALQQLKDYKKNFNFLKKNFGINSISASYPFGRYNLNTLKIMKILKIQIAFLSQQSNNNSNLRIGRIDHATIVKKLK